VPEQEQLRGDPNSATKGALGTPREEQEPVRSPSITIAVARKVSAVQTTLLAFMYMATSPWKEICVRLNGHSLIQEGLFVNRRE
jgi:hypothetical protein